VGKGIAEGLIEAGARVYATGRTIGDADLPSECVRIRCDHTDDSEVKTVFQRIAGEQAQLDILVNNVWGGYERMVDEGQFTWALPFWQQPIWRWDAMFAAGVRAHYVASQFAAGRMVQQGKGLIVNISFWAARKYTGNVAYGVAKAATDKMTADMAWELAKHNVAVVSLYPGLVRTEKVLAAAAYLDLTNSESPQFIGRAVAALATDPDIMEMSGKVLIAAECARKYNFADIDAKNPVPLRFEDV
jgi:dehydrogenase/reductase SDR family protein 1